MLSIRERSAVVELLDDLRNDAASGRLQALAFAGIVVDGGFLHGRSIPDAANIVGLLGALEYEKAVLLNILREES